MTTSNRFTSIHDCAEALHDIPRSSLVRELEIIEQEDYRAYLIIATFLRRAENRVATKGLQEYYDSEPEFEG